jgi:hypothetical protein
MHVTPLSIAGAFVFEPRVFDDPRGHFAETFKATVFADAVGTPCRSHRRTSPASSTPGLTTKRGSLLSRDQVNPARAFNGSHQARLSTNHFTVSARPCSKGTSG